MVENFSTQFNVFYLHIPIEATGEEHLVYKTRKTHTSPTLCIITRFQVNLSSFLCTHTTNIIFCALKSLPFYTQSHKIYQIFIKIFLPRTS